jgi:cold shock CspA family protein
MTTGKLIKLVHLSQQRFTPNTRLVPDHNDKGYGIIEDEHGREVYFSHEAVESRNGFDNLHQGQQVDYTLDIAPYLRAASVRMVTVANASLLRPAA